MSARRYYIIAGEASGDLHGSNLIREIKNIHPQASFRCWGGDLMQAQGADVVKHYRELAFMGFIQVIRNLGTILRNFKNCKADIAAYRPDILILIDYPGFNLRMAKWAHENNIKVVYYISPQIWAWKENRIHQIKKYVDKMLVILPFEKAFYQKWDYEVDYVGHPLVKVVDDFLQKNPTPQISTTRKQITLLPGSRSQEIQYKLKVMLEVSRFYPDCDFTWAVAPGFEKADYDSLLRQYPNVKCLSGQTYHLLSRSDAAIVTSGTATLETALFGVPQIICYKSDALSYRIAKKLIKVKFIGLANLIMDKEVVKEMIQDELTAENIKKELDQILYETDRRQEILDDYQALRTLLSSGGDASKNAAVIIANMM
jgi:lipid-A-disaccharide synthase